MAQNPERTKRARNVPLIPLLKALGVPLKKEGHRYYRVDEHYIIDTKENCWYANEGDHHRRDAIDWMREREGETWGHALKFLNDFDPGAPAYQVMAAQSRQSPAPAPSQLAPVLPLDAAGRTYLHKERCIPLNVIDSWCKAGLVFTDDRPHMRNNLVFPIYQPGTTKMVGQIIRGIGRKKFHQTLGVKDGGVVRTCGSPQKQTDIWLFEAPIDAMAAEAHFKPTDCTLIAMGGNFSSEALSGLLEALQVPLEAVTLMFDNDDRGNEMADRFIASHPGVKKHLPPAPYKDWDELVRSQHMP